ncbi:MAG TPA: MFS transporter [Actinocrinis sp.]|nr:MFS transporter [Actinocrinis sp.]
MHRRGPTAADSPQAPTAPFAALLSAGGGLAVANVYYAQPLLHQIGAGLHMRVQDLGLATAVTQLGYLLGLALIVPLGDLIDRRLLIVGQALLAACGLVAAGLSTSAAGFLAAGAVVGLACSVVQVIVAYAAALSPAERRGRTVGVVTGGVVTGILLARTVSGSIALLLGWRAVFLLSAALMLAMAAVLGRRLPRERHGPARPAYRRLVVSVFALTARDHTFRVRSILAALMFGGFGALWGSMALPLSAAPWHLTSAQIGLFGIAGAAGAFGARGAGRLADAGRAHVVTGTSLTLLLAAWAAIRAAPFSLVLLALGVVVFDLAGQALHVTNQHLIVERDPLAASRLIGGYMLYYSLGTGGGAIAATRLYSLAGWNAVCAFGAGLSALALLVWSSDRLRSRHRPERRRADDPPPHPHPRPVPTDQGAS